jgi:predicted acetyltransferase
MEYFRELGEPDYEDYLILWDTAYPGLAGLSERKEIFRKRLGENQTNTRSRIIGYFRDERLLGAMTLIHYEMNVFGRILKAGGIASVAVDFTHKKEHVAKSLMAYAMKYAYDCGEMISLLYPFRPDFYYNMGYGTGQKKSVYRLKPAQIPAGKSKEHICYLKKEDCSEMYDLYHRTYLKTHGLLGKSEREIKALFSDPSHRLVGYRYNGKLQGYIALGFKPCKPDNFICNDMEVLEWVYENNEAFGEFCTFLRSQHDQIRQIIIYTEDDSFYFLTPDPRDGSEVLIPSVYHQSGCFGVGLMYRILDSEAFIRLYTEKVALPEKTGPVLRWEITDSFLSTGTQTFSTILFNGRLHPTRQPADTTLRIGISEFSSLVLGCCDLLSLYTFNKVSIDHPEKIELIAREFRGNPKPVCYTAF